MLQQVIQSVPCRWQPLWCAPGTEQFLKLNCISWLLMALSHFLKQ
jgi:hypothetical protein